MASFLEELEALLNKHGMFQGSNTDASVLALYLDTCLVAFDNATKAREIDRRRPDDITDDGIDGGSSPRA